VRTARLLAAVLARRAGIDEALIDEVKLAVGEACARAVGIHLEHAGDQEVVVNVVDDGGCLAVTVRDRGPHDADTATPATGAPVAHAPELVDVDGAASDAAFGMPDGFGLALIAGLVDDVTVTAVEPGTEVRMSWPIPAADAAGDGAATL
jgi:anti-sigma regulatory factor (Ser/Thr protein kinase)